LNNDEVFTGYLSDISDDKEDSKEVGGEGCEGEGEGDEIQMSGQESSTMLTASDTDLFRVHAPPLLKRQKLDVSVKTAQLQAKTKRYDKLADALTAIEKLIASNKTKIFAGGQNGLQAYRAHAIQSCLQMVVQNKRKLIVASQQAAESQNFAEAWGGRQVRSWVRAWIMSRSLPISQQGHHVKLHTLLSDPTICAELRSYVWSNKWSMDPAKLAEFTQNKLIPDAAERSVHQVVNVEMPNGLKRYLELELFPWVTLKVGKGISFCTAQ